MDSDMQPIVTRAQGPSTPASPMLPARSNKTQRVRTPLAPEAAADALSQGPDQLVVMLAYQLEQQNWGPVVHLMHIANFMSQCKPFLAKQLAASAAPRVLLDVMRGILEADEGPDATETVMAKASEMLLYLVETDQAECTADILTADSVTVLLQALTSTRSGPLARQHIAHLLRRVVASGPAWRGPLLAHGGLEGLPRVLHDPITACDLLFMQKAHYCGLLLRACVSLFTVQDRKPHGLMGTIEQLREVLWVLVGLVDAAVSGSGGDAPVPDMQSLLGTLVPLLQLLQLPCHAHLNHISALLIRVLHVLAAGDDVSKQMLGQLGVVNLLVRTIRAERGSEMEAWESELQAGGYGGSEILGAAPGYSRNSSARFAGAEATSPLVGFGRSQSMQQRSSYDAAASGNQRTHLHGTPSTPLPDMPDVTAWDRLMAALLIQAILASPVPSARSNSHADGQGADVPEGHVGDEPRVIPAARVCHSQMAPSALVCYGLLLPLMLDDYTPSVNRLCVVKEAAVAIKTLVSDSPANQDRAVSCGAVPVLVHLVATGDVTLAWQAADALSNLAGPKHAPVLLANGVVQEVTQLLQESADALHLLTVRKQLEDHAISGTTPSLPTPHAAYANRSRHKKAQQARVQLVGRQPISFSGSSCMYTLHDSYSMCDYCVPSACLRALLRVLGACSQLSSSSQAQQTGLPYADNFGPEAGAQRFVGSGGLYTLFLLLHHELSGVHHSKMASSLISLLNMVLDTGLDVQDEVRKVGGLALLICMLESTSRPQGITDIYQLRVQTCMALARLAQGNSANKLVARERGLITLLANTLQSALDPNTTLVLDDKDQVLVCVLDVLSACIADSAGNVDALVSVGGLRHVNEVVMQEMAKLTAAGSKQTKPSAGKGSKGSPAVLAAAVRTLGYMTVSSQAAQLVLLSGPMLSMLVQLAEQQPTSQLSQNVIIMCCQLIAANPQGKQHAITANLLPLLLKLMDAPAGPHIAAAAQGIYALCVGDIDQQNEVVSAERGGLRMLETLVTTGGPYSVHALWLLCCLLHGNSYAKNAVRGQCPNLPRHLLAFLGPQVLSQPEAAMAASHAIAYLCQSNHSNQELVAEQGALEAATAVLQALLNPDTDLPEAAGMDMSLHGHTAARSSSLDSNGGLSLPGLEHLTAAVAYGRLLDGVLRMLASLLEFNTGNQKLARECGCLTLLAKLLLRVAEVRDLNTLRKAGLQPVVAGACAVVAHASQDCEENQRALMTGHEDLAPALFRLLSIDEPYVVLEVAHALEHMVIRSDLVHEQGEDRAEFEADAIRSLVHVLHARGGAPNSHAAGQLPASITAGMQAAAFWGPSTLTSDSGAGTPAALSSQPTSASVREAAAVLNAVVQAANTAAASMAASTTPSGIGLGQKSAGSATDGSARFGGLSGLARMFTGRKGSPSLADGAAKQSSVDSNGQSPAVPPAAGGESGAAPGDAVFDGQQQSSTDFSTDHVRGLVTSSSLNLGRAMTHAEWLRLVGQSAAAFQPIARQLADSPWRSVKVQLAWLLFLLAARTTANRALISKLERSVVAPLAAQLANAETFFASAEAAAALTEVAEAAPAATPLPVSTMAHDSLNRDSGPLQAPHDNLPSPASQQSRRHTTNSSRTTPQTGANAFTHVTTHGDTDDDHDPWDAADPALPPTQLASAPAPISPPLSQAKRLSTGSAGAAVPTSHLAVPLAQSAPAVLPSVPLVQPASGATATSGARQTVASASSLGSEADEELEYIRHQVAALAGVGGGASLQPPPLPHTAQ